MARRANEPRIWERVHMAWNLLSGRARHRVPVTHPRPDPPPLLGDEPEFAREGFVEEAIPWLDAVYAFALRLTRGDASDAEDLTQETFLRAHRFWDQFERGTKAKSWLFTICRNTYLHQRDLARNRRERSESDLDATVEVLAAASAFAKPSENPEGEFFDRLIDGEVLDAIDALPDAFREVLVLTDLGELTQGEVSSVLGIPEGTVKSRLYRARRILQEELKDFAVRNGYRDEEHP